MEFWTTKPTNLLTSAVRYAVRDGLEVPSAVLCLREDNPFLSVAECLLGAIDSFLPQWVMRLTNEAAKHVVVLVNKAVRAPEKI